MAAGVTESHAESEKVLLFRVQPWPQPLADQGPLIPMMVTLSGGSASTNGRSPEHEAIQSPLEAGGAVESAWANSLGAGPDSLPARCPYTTDEMEPRERSCLKLAKVS